MATRGRKVVPFAPRVAKAPEKRAEEIVHEVDFTGPELLRLRMIVSRWGTKTTAEGSLALRLRARVMFRATEREEIGYYEGPDGRVRIREEKVGAWIKAMFRRTLNEQERQVLLYLVQSPPEGIPWVTEEIETTENPLLIKLGGTPIEIPGVEDEEPQEDEPQQPEVQEGPDATQPA